MNITILCKLPKDDGTGVVSSIIRVQTEWSQDSFRITLLDNDTVWVGKASSADLIATSKNLSLEIEDYIQETRTALTTQGGVNEFTYAIEDDQFMWKKIVDSNSQIKIRFGSVPIEMVPTIEMIEYMMDTVIDANCNLQTKVASLEKEKEILNTENENINTKLLLYMKEKKTMEETLYSKFIQILNAKKQRIVLLEEKIESSIENASASSDVRTGNPLCTGKSSKTGKSTRKQPPVKKKKTITFYSSDENTSNTPPLKKRGQNHAHKRNESTVQKTTSKIGSVSQVASTSSLPNKPSLQNHYDSETDCDSSTEEVTNTTSVGTFSRTLARHLLDDVLDDNISIHSSVALPERDQHLEPNKNCKTLSLQTLPINCKDTAVDREAARELNTQQLLDELGI